MLSVFRNRVGVSGIVALVALVLAMTGGAWAASKYIITSVKQIKPNVRKALEGQTGPTGPAGPAGANGTNGVPGTNGTNGADGADGVDGVDGESVTNTKLEPGEGECTEGGAEFTVGAGEPTYACNGEPGEDGAEGSPWVAGSVPTGSEMRGTWATNTNAAAAEFIYAALPTGVPLANGVSIVLRAPGTLGTIECAGSAENPLPATNEGNPASGVLCLYTGESLNMNSESLLKKVSNSKGGIVVRLKTAAAGPAFAFGSWGMYAP
jgi:hypothetical protein